VKIGEVFTRVSDFERSVAKPLDIFDNVLDVLLTFLFRVGIVKAEVAVALVLLGNHETETHGLGMSNMDVTIRFRRETSMH
jgi:hypothetical protein